jgi:hypothetical protein
MLKQAVKRVMAHHAAALELAAEEDISPSSSPEVVAPAARAKPRKVQFCGDFDDINYDRHERSIITLQRFFRVRARTLYRISAWNDSFIRGTINI